MIAVQILVDKLNSFDTPKDIAEFLLSQNITGRKGSARYCVISNWIARDSGELHISTAPSRIRVWRYNSRHEPRIQESYGFSEAARNFISKFDLDQYPELDEDACDTRTGIV